MDNNQIVRQVAAQLKKEIYISVSTKTISAPANMEVERLYGFIQDQLDQRNVYDSDRLDITWGTPVQMIDARTAPNTYRRYLRTIGDWTINDKKEYP